MSHRPGPFYEVDAPYRSYKDFRSDAISRKRGKDQYHKYIKYSNVNRGQAQVAHYQATKSVPYAQWPAQMSDCKVLRTLTKREFYTMARDGKRCRHHGPCVARRWNEAEVIYNRGSKYAKEEAKKWMKCDDEIVPAWWNWKADGVAGACLDCPRCVRISFFDPEGHDLQMKDIVAFRGQYFASEDWTGTDDDTASLITSFTDDWSEVDSVASWDDYIEIAESLRENADEWSEVGMK